MVDIPDDRVPAAWADALARADADVAAGRLVSAAAVRNKALKRFPWLKGDKPLLAGKRVEPSS